MSLYPRSGSEESETGDSLQQYMAEISGSEPLPSAKEQELARRIRQGDWEAGQELVEANLRFVVAVAQRYRNNGVPLPDLISAGNLGLITAAQRFDPDKGYRFITYAVWWVRQAIFSTLTQQARPIRIPANREELLRQIPHCQSRLEQKHSSSIGEEELATRIGISVQALRDTLASKPETLSLNKPILEGGEDRSGQVADSNQESPDNEAWRNSLRQEIDDTLDKLDDREQLVLRLYFGLDNDSPLNLKQIGDKLGVCRERARQIKQSALARLKLKKNAGRLLPYLEEFAV